MEAELLVSIHCNSDVYDSSSGFECYALPPSWEGHAESVSLAQAIVSGGQRFDQPPDPRGKRGAVYVFLGLR